MIQRPGDDPGLFFYEHRNHTSFFILHFFGFDDDSAISFNPFGIINKR